MTKIIRLDLDGSKIVQTKGSRGYQVWFRGKFLSFFVSIEQANNLLSKWQERVR